MSKEFIPLNIAIVTVSDTRTVETDRSGQTAVDMLSEAGHQIVRREIVTDNREIISDAFGRFIDDEGVDVIISTGGTGVTPRDVTPEALEPHVTKAIPGFGELFRWISFEEIGTSTIQSRAVAALCKTTYVFVLPGSTGAVKTAIGKILLSQLDHRFRPCNFVELLPRVREEKEDPPRSQPS
jgi:molybdenum cofactor biosynthesis protein B